MRSLTLVKRKFISGDELNGTINAAIAAENKPHYNTPSELVGDVACQSRTHKDEDLFCIPFQEFESPPVKRLCAP